MSYASTNSRLQNAIDTNNIYSEDLTLVHHVPRSPEDHRRLISQLCTTLFPIMDGMNSSFSLGKKMVDAQINGSEII